MRGARLAVLVSVIALATLAGAIYAGNGKVWTDPDANRSAEEAEAAHQAAMADYFGRLPDWIEKTGPTLSDYSKLPHQSMMIQTVAPDASLDEAIAASDVIVDGVVMSVQFRRTIDTVVTINVASAVRGDVGKTVQVIVPGGILPWPDWDHVIVSYAESAPIPNIGAHLLILANASDTDPGMFSVRHWTGTYVVDSAGLVEPLAGNPWAAEINGRSLIWFEEAATAVDKASAQ